MAEIYKIEDFRQAAASTAREVTFYSPLYRNTEGKETTCSATVRVEDGDALGIINAVKEDGGLLWKDDDGTFFYLPWPCAAVEIRDVE